MRQVVSEHPFIIGPSSRSPFELTIRPCRGRGLVIDLGPQNRMCRFFVSPHPWTKPERERYDRYSESPHPYRLHKSTLVVRVSFVRLSWDELYPRMTRPGEFVLGLIKSRSPSILVCDMFAGACIRLPHARFVLPQNEFPDGLRRYSGVFLKTGTFDQYHVHEDGLIDAITSVLDGQSQTRFGHYGTIVDSHDYYCRLGDALDQGTGKWSAQDVTSC